MREINAAICDDESMALNMVSSALKSCFAQQKVSLKLEKFTSSETFSKAIPGNQWELVFLDIDIPGLDGIELGKKLKAEKPDVVIIYISNCEDRVFDAFAAHPFGFVRKSSFLKDVESVVRLYIKEVIQKEKTEESLEVKIQGGITRLKINNIMYIECDKDYQDIYMADTSQKVRIQQRMNILEENLKKYGFLRVHTGYLVNHKYVVRIENDHVQLQNDIVVPMSRRRKKEIVLEYMRLSRGNKAVKVNLLS